MVLSEICQSFFSDTIFVFGFYTKIIHWFLIPAVLFAFAWSFLERRKSLKTNILGGRPALYSVINLLDGGVKDRWATSFILGAMTALVINLTYGTLLSSNLPPWSTGIARVNWSYFIGQVHRSETEVVSLCVSTTTILYVQVLMVYLQALEATFLALPLFVCLTTRFRLLGGVIGLLYAFGWAAFSTYNVAVPLKCFLEVKSNISELDQDSEWNKNMHKQKISDSGIVEIILKDLPVQICFICIVMKFITTVYDCVKTGEFTLQNENEIEVTSCKIYVKHLIDPVRSKATQSTKDKYLKMFFNNIPGFTYSVPIFSTAFMMAILLYEVILVELFLVHYWTKLLESDSLSWAATQKKSRTPQILLGCGIASCIATGIFGVSSIFSLLMRYKRHMLMMYKGERRFLPEGTEKENPEKLLLWSTQYMGNQILGMFCGAVIFFVCLFLPLSLLCIFIDLVEKLEKIPQLLEQLQLLVYPVTVFIIYRVQIFIVGRFLLQERLIPTDRERPLAIDNRKAHDLFKFFMLFVNLSLGIMVTLWRIVNNIFLGIFIVPRMDRSMFPNGFECEDQFYMSYVGMLMVDFTHNDPIMRVFCSLLLKAAAEKHNQRNDVHTTAPKQNYENVGLLSFPRPHQGHSRARTKWLLAYTLIKNPSIAGTRKHALSRMVLMAVSEPGVDAIDRVRQNITSTMIVYTGMTVVLMIYVFIIFGFKTILENFATFFVYSISNG